MAVVTILTRETRIFALQGFSSSRYVIFCRILEKIPVFESHEPQDGCHSE